MSDEERAGVPLTHLDQPLFDGAGATKRDLVDYLDAVSGLLIAELRDRPLSVIRALRGQAPFMQKNVPKYTPDWVRTVPLWAEASRREVSYALCNDRRTLLWFANQRAVEYHPMLALADRLNHPSYLILDLDPPEGDAFGLAGAVKTSGAKGVHVFVPVEEGATSEEVAAATRAIAARAERLDPALATTAFIREDRAGKVFIDPTRTGGATVVAAYSPRIRPGVPVSFPLSWDELDDAAPGEHTLHTAIEQLGGHDRWIELLPAPQPLPAELIEEGQRIPIARVQAMHAALRRRRTGG